MVEKRKGSGTRVWELGAAMSADLAAVADQRQKLVEGIETTFEVPILMYHSIAEVGPEELRPYRISPEAFGDQLRFLENLGYTSISLSEWLETIADRRLLPGRRIIITFDDGYANFILNAFPLLERAGFTATMFVVTDKVGDVADWDEIEGEKLSLMNWDDLRYLRDRGVTIGSHTANHPSLPKLSTEEIVVEGERSRSRLREELGIDAKCIAFPYGHTDARVQQALARAGYTIGVGTWGGISTLFHDPMNLPRIEIFPDDDLATFAEKVTHRRPRLAKDVLREASGVGSIVSLPSDLRTGGDPMMIHPDYAQRLAAQLDKLVGDFVSLHSQILLGGAHASTLQSKLAQLFREPITGPVKQELGPYQVLSSGVCVGFEKGARVTLEVNPKAEQSASPEYCVNSLELAFSGPSRWLSLELPCEWTDLSAIQRFQLGVYANVSRNVPARALLRFPGKDGKDIDVPFANFELKREVRNVNRSGELKMPDFVGIDTDKRPRFLLFLDTRDIDQLSLRLDYLSLYFD